MKRRALPALVLASTFGWLAVLIAARPFDAANTVLDRAFGALPAWTQVENMYRDQGTQEVSRGSRPIESFRVLAGSWSARPDAVRVILMGNSQTLTTSLAPGEDPPSAPEKTYTDQIADHFRRNGQARVFYRLSAGGMSYAEMLWYTLYLSTRPAIRPNVLLVQLNYQNFANSGIRDGMLELLSDAAFRDDVTAIVRRGRADSTAFAEALRHYDEVQRRKSAAKDSSEGATPGYRLETSFRTVLDEIPGFQKRDLSKQAFVLMLYRCRSYILRLQPATRRSLGGARVEASRAALEDLAERCGRAGIRMIPFHAPTNPAVPLYRTTADDRSYHDFAGSLSTRYGLTLLDFEHSIPQEYWGMELNVPDPLHLGREGHRRLAGLMLEKLGKIGL